MELGLVFIARNSVFFRGRIICSGEAYTNCSYAHFHQCIAFSLHVRASVFDEMARFLAKIGAA
jgi:hypothetical protein